MRTRRSAKHLSDDGCDQTERGEPTHSPDQQLRHGAVSPCCQRRRLIQGKEQKEPESKKEPRVDSGARAWQSKSAASTREPALQSCLGSSCCRARPAVQYLLQRRRS